MSDASVKRKNPPSILNLSLFVNLSEPKSSKKTQRRSFGGDGGVVGLGIVAAMSEEVNREGENKKTHVSVSPKSMPIPIVSVVKPFVRDEPKLSESYTCVISRVGEKDLVKRREYFGGDEEEESGDGDLVSGVFFTSSPKYLEFGSVVEGCDGGDEDFLSSCCLCKSKLCGRDIFMYRGDKAFCSEECRNRQIRIDERKRKRKSGSVKKPFDISESPCSAPRFFTASVAAA